MYNEIVVYLCATWYKIYYYYGLYYVQFKIRTIHIYEIIQIFMAFTNHMVFVVLFYPFLLTKT